MYGCEPNPKSGAERHLFVTAQEWIDDIDALFAVSGNYLQELKAEAADRFSRPEMERRQGVVRKTTNGTPFLENTRYAKENSIGSIVILSWGHMGAAPSHMYWWEAWLCRLFTRSFLPGAPGPESGIEFVMP